MLGTSELHHTLVADIAERTGGNPFFIEEVVRSLIDEEALLPKNGSVQWSKSGAAIQIPATVEDVLMATN
jgi:predicted ATPase